MGRFPVSTRQSPHLLRDSQIRSPARGAPRCRATPDAGKTQRQESSKCSFFRRATIASIPRRDTLKSPAAGAMIPVPQREEFPDQFGFDSVAHLMLSLRGGEYGRPVTDSQARYPLPHPLGPVKKPYQLAALLPHETPEFLEPDGVGVQAPVGLDAPAQVWTAPGSEAVAARGAPQIADHFILQPRRAACPRNSRCACALLGCAVPSPSP